MDIRAGLDHLARMDILSVFGIRGRAKEVYRLDGAMRAFGLEPKGVPDSVKLTVLRLLKDAEGGAIADIDVSCERVAPVLAYCVLGRDDFDEVNGSEATAAAEARLRHAIDSGESLDARVAMLTLLANVVEPGVVERFDLAVD